MAKLSTATRKAMPKSAFAGPGRSFPVNDATHARLAISGATRSERAGNISASTAASIKTKARAKLDRRTKVHQDSVRTGKSHPASHAEFEMLGK